MVVVVVVALTLWWWWWHNECMVICPKCGAVNGQRTADPVKCCRCWYQFKRCGVPGRVAQLEEQETLNLKVAGSIPAAPTNHDSVEHLCGFRSYNGEDGEWYRCGFLEHSDKVKHGKWVKEG